MAFNLQWHFFLLKSSLNRSIPVFSISITPQRIWNKIQPRLINELKDFWCNKTEPRVTEDEKGITNVNFNSHSCSLTRWMSYDNLLIVLNHLNSSNNYSSYNKNINKWLWLFILLETKINSSLCFKTKLTLSKSNYEFGLPGRALTRTCIRIAM